MTKKEIKKRLIDLDLTVAALAREFGCQREELSMCINRARVYPALRKKLAKRLKVPVEVLFPDNDGEGAEAA